MNLLKPDTSIVPSGFPRSSRLLTPGDYRHVFQGKNIRVSNHLWTILAVASDLKAQKPTPSDSERVESCRLGLAIAKKRARRAVDRNRCKRVARESFRHNQVRLGGFDIVVMNRDDSAKATAPELRKAIEQLWDKLLKIAATNPGSSERKATPEKARSNSSVNSQRNAK